VRHGPVVGIHNGIILNDDALLEPLSCARCEPSMTVDSEAIFALAAHSRNEPRALEALTGSMAAAWMDARVAGTIFAARGVGRPLWIGRSKHELFFASTKAALEVVERYAGVRLRKREVGDGTFLELRSGRIVREERFRPDHSYRDPIALPAVRAPGEGVSCLARLAALAAAA
jgi:glutamine phosphoribosylpyrophosphate amidotransferase